MPELFNWRDYINVSDMLGGDKLLMEQALDRIVAAGEDGQTLIKAAHHGRKITIASSRDPYWAAVLASLNSNSSGAIPMFNTLVFRPRDFRMLVVSTPNGPKQLSLTGILVHELFHLADPESIRLVQCVDKFVVSDTLNPEQKFSVYLSCRTLAALRDMSFDDPMHRQILAREGDGFLSQVSSFSGVPLPDLSLNFAAFDPPEGTPVHERDATRYTDVFMRKHFPTEPWRGDYENAHSVYADNMRPIVPALGKGDYVSGVYEPKEVCLDNLGYFSQPVITKTPDDKEQAPVPPRK